MDFFTLIGLLVIIYLFVYIVALSVSDCDLSLLWADKINNQLHMLRDKVVWITGASSGIGEHLAIELCRHGAKVIISARNEANLAKVKQRCVIDGGALPDNVSILPLDVTDYTKHEQAFQKVIQQYGKLDVLVNNAGRSQRAVWELISVDVDKQVFDLNVFSVISLSRLALKYFSDQGSGHLVVTSSLAGIVPAPFSSSYTGSKHAIHGYFNSLRNEKMGVNLDITLLCPGPVFSNFLNEAFTSTPGEKFGQKVASTDRRMTAERCAYLSAVAIANKVDEAWMALFPLLPLCYVLTNYPYLTRRILKLFGPQAFQRMRDSRQTVES